MHAARPNDVDVKVWQEQKWTLCDLVVLGSGRQNNRPKQKLFYLSKEHKLLKFNFARIHSKVSL